MSEMIERVARGLHVERRKLGPNDSGCGPTWEQDSDFHRHVCRKDARAAIAAMREPTMNMLEAAHNRLAGDGTVKDIYRAMIDVALEGAPESDLELAGKGDMR